MFPINTEEQMTNANNFSTIERVETFYFWFSMSLDLKHLLKDFQLSLEICEKAYNSHEVLSLLFKFYETHGKGSEFSQFIVQTDVRKAGIKQMVISN